MSEESKTFVVNDRRSFTAEGERRPEPAPSTAPEPVEAEHGSARQDAPLDLLSFALSQALSARSLLTSPPQDMSPSDVLAGAKYFISVLEMLQSRTSGNRTEEESALLEKLLFEIRMAFVEKVREGKQ
jgi:hypothetical protein